MSKENATSNYFTLVVYPLEFKNDNVLWLLGSVYDSPIHNAKQPNVLAPNGVYINKNFITYLRTFENTGKPHIHKLVKTPNKITENSFIEKLCRLLGNNLEGIAIHKGDCLVKEPSIMLRYFYHLDSPMKEPFDYTFAFKQVPRVFTKEIVSAFDLEIRENITLGIQTGIYENINQIVFANEYSLVYTEWLYRGRNMYVINSMFNELRKMR